MFRIRFRLFGCWGVSEILNKNCIKVVNDFENNRRFITSNYRTLVNFWRQDDGRIPVGSPEKYSKITFDSKYHPTVFQIPLTGQLIKSEWLSGTSKIILSRSSVLEFQRRHKPWGIYKADPGIQFSVRVRAALGAYLRPYPCPPILWVPI